MRSCLLALILLPSCTSPVAEVGGFVDEGIYYLDPHDCIRSCQGKWCGGWSSPDVSGVEVFVSDVEAGRYALELVEAPVSDVVERYYADCEVASDGSFLCVEAAENPDLAEGLEWSIEGQWSDRRNLTGTSIVVETHENYLCTFESTFDADWEWDID